MKGDKISEQPLATGIEVGVSAFVLPGQQASGDDWLIQDAATGTLVAVVDGCGHGPEAAAAAKAAVAVLETNPGEDVVVLLKRCHERLRGTRGAVMSLASFNVLESTLTWIGVGNVEGVLFRSQSNRERETLLLRAGVLGYRLPALRPALVPIGPGDTVVFTTDGIRMRFIAEVSPYQAVQSLADEICTDHCKGTDDSVVLVARYRGLGS